MNRPVAVAPLPRADLAHVLQFARQDLEKLRGARIFVTGGTGFFGKWLVGSFLHANRELQLGASMTVLTRDPEKFHAENPDSAADPSLLLHAGDVRTFAFPEGRFGHAILGASSAGSGPLDLFSTIVDGTRHTLDFATRCGVQRVLFLSSGAVYGAQPSVIRHVPETYHGALDQLQPGSTYGVAKRAAEHLCRMFSGTHVLESVVARCFAFSGPYLPLNANFAIGNFIGDVMAGHAISIQGDGTPYRSYLYAADLAVWLWALLVRGRNGRAYNVGSNEDVTIADLARAVAEESGTKTQVHIARTPVPGVPPSRYVPSIDRARSELGLEPRILLRDGVRRTFEWLRQANPAAKSAP
jgi:nucleoside-diphosphate-sugar epimerase